jgi:hypothetical protein
VLTASFYDVRDNPGSTTLVDMYMAQSFDGGNTWLPNVRLTSDSTNAALAPNTGPVNNPAYMLGDYLAIAGATADPNVPAVPVWIDTRTGNPDPFVSRVRIAPSSVAKADFNADGQADFVWQNTQTGRARDLVSAGTANIKAASSCRRLRRNGGSPARATSTPMGTPTSSGRT